MSLTFPFFALVLIGYIAAARGTLPMVAIAGLNSFVLFIALPCMLFRFGSAQPVAQLFDPKVVLVYLASATVLVGVVVLASPRARLGWNDTAFGALIAAFPNTGFMGVPLVVALWGPRAAAPAILLVLLDMVYTTSLCIALSRLDGRGGAIGSALRNVFKGVLSNPLPWSIGLGALVSALQWTLPTPVDKTIALLADAASPVALFTIGAVLARSRWAAREGHAPATPWRDYVPLALAKLLLHPALVWGIGTLAIGFGLPLDGFTLNALVLLAALPSASNVSLLAERYGADNGRIARTILVSTLVAFITFSAIVTLLA